MLDKDKLWIVLHVDVSAYDTEDVQPFLEGLAKEYKYDESVNTIIIPERRSVEHPVEILQTPCVLFPIMNNATIKTKRLDD